MAGALGIGFSLLLKARRRGGPILWSQTVGQGTALVLASALALRSGLTGAAWGQAGAAVFETLSLAWFCLSRSDPSALADNPGVA